MSLHIAPAGRPQDTSDFLSRERAAMLAALPSYDAFHARRFAMALALAQRYCPDPSAQVLDIGRSTLTERLLSTYRNVSTLDFAAHANSSVVDMPDGTRRELRAHHQYDLNTAQSLTPVATTDRFDLIVFAEVIEHLHTAPELVLDVLVRLMKPNGYMILQTPNAAALHKRLLLMIGLNPYERIRVDPTNPGHFREYTRRELLSLAEGAGLDVVSHCYADYFGIAGPGRAYLYLQRALSVVWPSFARGQTIVLQMPAAAST